MNRKKNERINYIRMTKKKIYETRKEHITDLKFNKETTCLARNNFVPPPSPSR